MVLIPGSGETLYGIDLALYGLLFRMRMLYMTGIAVAIIVAITIGGTMQLLYSIYGNPSSMPVVTVATTYLMVPGISWFTAIVTTRLCILVVDILDIQPLVHLRALLQVATGAKASRVDGGLILLTELVPIVGWIARIVVWELNNEIDPEPLIMGYFEAGIMWSCVLALVEAICLGIVTMRIGKEEQYNKRVDELRHELFGHSLTAAAEHHHVFSGVVEALFHHPGKPVEKPKASLGFLLLLAGLTLPVAMGFAAHGHSLPFWTSLLSVVLGIVFLSEGTKVLVPKVLGNSYRVVVALFLTCAAAFTLLSTSLATRAIGPPPARGDVMYGMPPHGFLYTPVPSAGGYPVCQMTWGAEALDVPWQLHALDIATLSASVYNSDQEVQRLASGATEGTALAGMRLEYLEPSSIVGRWGVFTFPSSKLRVLAIRGTTTSEDAMVDLDLFATIQVMQFFDKVVPLLQILPSRTIQNFVNLFVARKLWGLPRIWDKLLAFAETLKAKCQADGFELVVTGHSLGGSLAVIVGARLSLPTLAFSPAGQQWSQKRFGVNLYELEKYVTVIQPDTDPVPKVDRQPGFRQQIRCLANPLVCHSITKTICELYTTCGDPRGRLINCAPDGNFIGPVHAGIQPVPGVPVLHG